MIDLARAKLHLKVEDAGDDELIGGYLTAAIGSVERETGKKLTLQSVTQPLNGFPDGERGIRLWWGPIDPDTAAMAIAYDDTSGAAQTLGDFRLVEGSAPKLLPAYGSLWPYAYPAEGSARITYMAGFADVAAEAPELDQAVLLLVAHFYTNREAASASALTEIPLGVEKLIRPYRPTGLA